MPAISFSIPEHVRKIFSGRKVNTIRPIFAGKGCRFNRNERLFLYWKQRTRHCTKLGEAKCRGVSFLLPNDPSPGVEHVSFAGSPAFRELEVLAAIEGFDHGLDLAFALWRFYGPALKKGQIRAFASVRWSDFSRDLFAEKRLAKLGILEGK